MVNNEDIVRELIRWCPDVVGTHPTRKEDAYRALDALVAEREALRAEAFELSRKFTLMEAERDEAVAKKNELVESGVAAVAEWTEYARAAEAENERLRGALDVVRAWIDWEEADGVSMGVPKLVREALDSGVSA